MVEGAAGVHTAVDDGGSAVLRHPVGGALISPAPRLLRECNDALSAGSTAEAERMPTLAGDCAISWGALTSAKSHQRRRVNMSVQLCALLLDWRRQQGARGLVNGDAVPPWC